MNGISWLFQSLFAASQFPGALRFAHARKHLKSIQKNILLTYLRNNRQTIFGKEHGFSGIQDITMYQRQVPARTYHEFSPYIARIARGEPQILTAEKVLYFLPTGGTTGTKRIPYTASLNQEFQNALAPWLFDISRHFPSMLCGKTYWSITPPGHRVNTLQEQKIPTGFEEDSAYFGWKGRLLGNIFAVPSWITQLHSIENFRFLTLYFLLQEKNLRWLSIWSPTFLLVMLEEFEKRAEALLASLHNGYPQLPEPEQLPLELRQIPKKQRARELEQLFSLPREQKYCKIWPNLSVVSLWKDASAKYPAQQLEQLFSQTHFQGKGLLATEGVMSLPLHHAHGCVPAFTSHFLEFVCDNGEAKCLWEVETGQTYSILLTTGGGLYRYDIGDQVTVTGYYHNLPILQFVGRKGRFSDLAGEKLEESFVHEALEQVLNTYPIAFTFLLIAPEEQGQTRSYVLFIETPHNTESVLEFTNYLENFFRKNIHYEFAVNMGQITPLQVFSIEEDGPETYLQRCMEHGQKMGDIKPLCFDMRTGWKNYFKGKFFAAHEP